MSKESRFLSLILRHKPEEIGLTLDENGWGDVQFILEKTGQTFDELKNIVETNNKKRFTFNDDFTKIRANQGHSIEINLNLDPTKPPDVLYHGTAIKNLNNILIKGLLKMNRQHVHLSADRETAFKVGQRHGEPIIFAINTKKMFEDNYKFYLSKNKVWLTDTVPNKYFIGLHYDKN
jgi:putative RNA 2'-phosphotransferase